MKTTLRNLWNGVTGFGLSAILLVGLLPVTTATTGCTSGEILSYTNSVISGVEAVLNVIAPNSVISTQLQSALTALVSAEASWKAGGAVAILEDALNTVVAVTAAIPLTAAYSPLIDIIVAGVEAVLALLPQQTSLKAVYNPHIGRARLAGQSLLHPTRVGAVKAQWNSIVASNRALAPARI